jgi:hypothetical protein
MNAERRGSEEKTTDFGFDLRSLRSSAARFHT